MKRTLQIVAIAATATCLAACGGGHSNSESVTTGPTTGTGTGTGTGSGSGSVTAMLDAFGTYVLGVIGMTSETSSPQSIDAVAATTPDNTYPAPVSQ